MTAGKKTGLLLAAVLIGYIFMGLPDTALGVLWKDMSAALAQPLERGGVLMMVLWLFSALASVPCVPLLRRCNPFLLTGLGLLFWGLFLVLGGFAGSFAGLCACFVFAGLLRGAADLCCNYVVANRGSSSHMNLMHALWSAGCTLGILLQLWAARGGLDWRRSFWLLGGAVTLGALALLALYPVCGREAAPEPAPEAGAGRAPAREPIAWSCRFFACGLVTFFHNTVLFSLTLWGVSFLTARGMEAPLAGFLVSALMGAVMAGRLATAAFVNRLGDTRTILLGLCTALLGAALLLLPQVPALAAGLALIGLGLGPIFPCSAHAAVWRFQGATATAALSLQVCSGTAGSCLMPLAAGYLFTAAGFSLLPYLALLFILLQLAAVWFIDIRKQPSQA